MILILKKIQKYFISMTTIVLILTFNLKSFSADESLEGNIVISDTFSDDFDGDLNISYQIETYYEGSGSGKSYAGFNGTFSGVSDGACNVLQLLFNQKLCQSATIKIKVPKANSDGEMEVFNSGEYVIDANSDQYATILTDTEVLFDNHSCSNLKADGCFYNTPEIKSNGECNTLSACQMCVGNSLSIEYICSDGFSIPSVETITVDPSTQAETTAYTFPVRKIFAINDGGTIVSDNVFRSDVNLPSITLTDSDAPITCENSNIARDLIDNSSKQNLNSVCGSNPNSASCLREGRKLMSLTIRKMTENLLSADQSKFFFKHSDISSSRATRLRPPKQTLGFLLYKYNKEDGNDIDIYDFKKSSSNRSSSATIEEHRYLKKYLAPCDSTCEAALESIPNNYGGTYTTPIEIHQNCGRNFRSRNIGIRRCSTEEIVSASIIQERIDEKNAAIGSGNSTCEQVKSSNIENSSGNRNNPNNGNSAYLLQEDFEYKTEAGFLDSNFHSSTLFRSRWNVHDDSGHGEIGLESINGTQMMVSKKKTNNWWGAGISTKLTFNAGIEVKFRHYIASHYTSGTSREGFFIYTGNRTNASSYGFPGGGTNLGSISTYMRYGGRLYMDGIFGQSGFVTLPTSSLPLVMDYTININTDLSWNLKVEFPEAGVSPINKSGNLTVNQLSDFYIEFFNGDFGAGRHSYFDDISVKNTNINCTLAGANTTGYITTSCPSSGNFKASACSSLSCDNSAGYYKTADSIRLTCNSEGGAFSLSGCSYFGNATNIISSYNTIHLDASNGVTTDSNNIAQSWISQANSSGETIRLTQSLSSGPELITQNGVNFIKFLGNGTETLYNPSFSGMSGKSKFTRAIVYKPEKTSTMLLYDNASGYDGYIRNNYLYTQTKYNDGYNSLDSGNDLIGRINIQITEYDSTKSVNTDKLKVRINGEEKNISIGKVNTPRQGSAGLTIGNWGGSTKYWYQGLVGEIIYFPTVLPEAARDKVEMHLLKKYGLVKTCTNPGTAGYDTSGCDTNSGQISQSGCSLSCAIGYTTHSSLSTPKAICKINNQPFTFYGCYPSNNPPNGNTIAENYIKSSNTLHLEASSGTTFDNSNKLQLWSSSPNKNGQIFELSNIYNGGGATLTTQQNGAKFLEFDGYTDKIRNLAFDGLTGIKANTKISVSIPKSSNRSGLDYSSSGYSLYLNNNRVYSYANSSVAPYIPLPENFLDQIIVQSTRVDSTAIQSERYKLNFNKINQTNVSTVVPLDSKSNTTKGVTVGGYPNTSSPWVGSIGEIIYFDHKISDQLNGHIENYLMKKYGLIKSCMPPGPGDGTKFDAYDISCTGGENGLYSIGECAISCKSGYTQYADIELICESQGGSFTAGGCGARGIAKDSFNSEASKFAIKPIDHNKFFESSYSVYSLPDPKKLRDGWYTTIKAINGPVYVYPSYLSETTNTAPQIDGSNNKVILKNANTEVEFTYQSGNWTTNTLSGATSYSVLKNDAPLDCPDGYTSVNGNFLLETNGFCVDINGSSVSGRISDLLNSHDTNCATIPFENGGGTATVITDKQFASMIYDSLEVYKNNPGDFYGQFNNGRTSCFGSAATNDNEINLLSGATIKLHHSSPTPGYCGCNSGRKASCRTYYQHNSSELLSWQGRYSGKGLNQGSCDNNYNNQVQLNTDFKNHILTNSDGKKESTFNVENFYYQDESVLGCDFSNLMSFSGLQSSVEDSKIKFLEGISTFYASNPSTNFAPIYQKSFNSRSNSNRSALNIFMKPLTDTFSGKVRCAYSPGEFICDLPDNTTGYNTSNCQASPSSKIKPSQCVLSCLNGYSAITGVNPSAECNANVGTQEGTFILRGCYQDSMLSDPPKVSSCQNVSSEGIYKVDLIDSSNNVQSNVKVFCAIDKAGAKSIDIIKTMKLAAVDGTESTIGQYFFTPNNNSSLIVSSRTNDKNTLGILVRNLGENISGNYDYTSGFHLHKGTQIYDYSSIKYYMQGSGQSDHCSTSGWIPLSGPGYEGGSRSHKSSVMTGFTSIQGSAQDKKDGPIQSYYTDSNIASNAILTFSGSGKDNNQLYSCNISENIPKVGGVPKPSTFFTKLLLNDSLTKHCTIPSLPAGMTINCGGTNSDGLYKLSQCSLGCNSGLSLYLSSINCNVDKQDFEINGFCTDNTELNADLDIDVLESFDTPTGYQTYWTLDLSGPYQRYEAIPYREYPTFGNSLACAATTTRPQNGDAICELSYNRVINKPSLNPLFLKFDISPASAHNQHTNFEIIVQDSNNSSSTVSWTNTGHTLYPSTTGALSSITTVPQLTNGNSNPSTIKVGFYPSGQVKLFTNSYPGGSVSIATGDASGISWPIDLKIKIKQTDFWGSNRETIIDEVRLFKEIITEELVGPF